MKALERLRLRRARRRAARAEQADEQARLRREIESEDRSLVEAVHPPVNPGEFLGPF